MGRNRLRLLLWAALPLAVLCVAGCENRLSAIVQADVDAYRASADLTPPSIDSFAITSADPNYYGVITFNLASATPGTGATSITHWQVNESPTAPTATDPNWRSFASPATDSYTLINPGVYGTRTIYAWLKNDRGLVSTAATDTVQYAAYGSPVIDSFTCTTGSTSYGTAGYSLSATIPGPGAASITHYIVNESAAAPLAADLGWLDFESPATGTYTLADPGSFGSRTVYAWVKNDLALVSASASFPVTYSDYGSPSIDAFTLTSGSPTDDPHITFNLSTTSYGAGSSSITGWLVNESSTQPAADAIPFESAPSDHTVGLTAGPHTVYAWAKNEHDKVSGVKSLAVTVRTPGASWASPYVNGYEVTAHEVLTLASDVDLQGTGLAASGIGTGKPTLGGDNRTVTVQPGATGAGLWNAGAGTLTVTGTTVYGIAFSKSISLTVFNGVCVAASGSDGSAGTVISPFATISYGNSQAQTIYKSQGRDAEVRVCKTGSHTTNWASSSNRIIVQNGVSLLGGFPTSFQSSGRSLDTTNPATLTTLTDGSSIGGASWVAANRAIDIDTEGIGRSTVIEGFNVQAGGGAYSVAIHLYDAIANSSYIQPTIRLNRAFLGSAATTGSAAIYSNAALPLIESNWVNSDYGSGLSGNSSLTSNYAVYLYQCAINGTDTAILRSNTIWGPTAATNSIAVMADVKSGSSLTIERNEVRSGLSLHPVAIRVDAGGTLSIHNNLIFAGYTTGTLGIPKCLNMASIAANVYFRNNTVLIGAASLLNSPTNAYGIWLNAPNTNPLFFQNNIFRSHAGGAPGTTYCFYESQAVLPTVQNNLWYDDCSPVKRVYHDSAPADYGDIFTFQASGAAAASGNVPGDPLLDGDYRLQTSSPPAARGGGIDGGASSWPFTNDKAGASRPTGSWSMGCYQY